MLRIWRGSGIIIPAIILCFLVAIDAVCRVVSLYQSTTTATGVLWNALLSLRILSLSSCSSAVDIMTDGRINASYCFSCSAPTVNALFLVLVLVPVLLVLCDCDYVVTRRCSCRVSVGN
ncbi:hypothetical protein F5Y10DRAFT_241005 [Nemania abortiva]|nr:hypothetical protein F5Y10DRAFT_241005 [Nemania abortiva]